MRIRRACRALQGLGADVGLLVFVVNDTYLEEYRHNQLVLSVSIEPMSQTPVSR